MGPASGSTSGRAELAARGGRDACGRFGRRISFQGGALTATRPELYGLPFALSCGIVAALRLLVASTVGGPMCECVRVGPGGGIHILNNASTVSDRIFPTRF